MNATRTTKTRMIYPQRPRVARAIASTALLSIALLSGCDTIRGWFGGGRDHHDDAPLAKPVQADPSAMPQYPAATQGSMPRTMTTPLPPSLQVISRPVTTGRLPQDGFIVYLIESDGPVRVANVDTGEDITIFDARAGQIVRVNSRGVTLANQPVIGATLAPGTYGIYKVPPGDAGVVRSTQGTSIPPTASATRPAVVAPPPGFESIRDDRPNPSQQPLPPVPPASQPAGAPQALPPPR